MGRLLHKYDSLQPDDEESRKRKRRLKALRWSLLLAVSYTSYKLIYKLMSTRWKRRNSSHYLRQDRSGDGFNHESRGGHGWTGEHRYDLNQRNKGHRIMDMGMRMSDMGYHYNHDSTGYETNHYHQGDWSGGSNLYSSRYDGYGNPRYGSHY